MSIDDIIEKWEKKYNEANAEFKYIWGRIQSKEAGKAPNFLWNDLHLAISKRSIISSAINDFRKVKE